MKKIALMISCAIAAWFFSSCQRVNTTFVGTWGVEKIEYETYNTDYNGNPIEGSMMSYAVTYDPQDLDNGIQLVFNADKTGEMRDSDRDTIWYDWNAQTGVYESYVVNPDTTLVTKFTYTYDKEASILYMNMQYEEGFRTFMTTVLSLTSNEFSYENFYDKDADNRVYVERAYLKRLSDSATSKSAGRKAKQPRPTMPGSMLSGR